MDVFPVDWALADRNGRCTVTCFGKLPDRRSVAVHLRWVPTFYVPLPRDASAQRLAARLVEEHGAVKSLCQVVHKKSLWGFRGGDTSPFLLLAFSTLAAHSRAKYNLRRAKVKTFEADVDPLLRCAGRRAGLRLQRAPAAESLT